MLVVPERRAALDALVLHATTLRIPVVELEGGTLTSLAGFDGHQGVALVVAERRWATLDEILARARTRGEAPLVLVLDSLEDPQNVGTLLRSAEACGVHGVLFPTRRAAPMTASAIKASAGASEHLLLAPVDDLPGALADLHARGLRIVGSDEAAPLAYRDADLRGPVAIIVGSEGRGVSGAVRRRLDLVVRIPMRGKVASLNAAVAGSVLLFEASAQRPMAVLVEPGPDVATEQATGTTAEGALPQPPAADTQPGSARRARSKKAAGAGAVVTPAPTKRTRSSKVVTAEADATPARAKRSRSTKQATDGDAAPLAATKPTRSTKPAATIEATPPAPAKRSRSTKPAATAEASVSAPAKRSRSTKPIAQGEPPAVQATDDELLPGDSPSRVRRRPSGS